MLADSVITPRIDRQRERQGFLSPKHATLASIHQHESYPQNNFQDIKKRPLNTNQSDLSFKGLSFNMYKPVDKVYSKKEFLEFANKHLDHIGKKLFDDITGPRASITNKLISVDGDKIIISKKTIPHLALDGILYPFKILPGDILNGTVQLLGKVPFLKKWSEKTLNKTFFKNIRQRSKIDAKVNSLVGLITFRDYKLNEAIDRYTKIHGKKPEGEALAKLKQDVEDKMSSSVLQQTTRPFDYKTGNYDTKHERALNRLVSGLPPAIFLANDAYNLSRMMDDDPKAANKERKTRFKQETSRILTSGYLTLITMGAFQKFINSSKMGIVLTTGITVLVTEMFSRLSNGKHITRLTPDEARKENEKNHAPEAAIKPTTFKANDAAPKKDKEAQKPLLSFDTLLKASAVILGAGYGIKGFKHIPAIKKAALNYFNKMALEKLQKLGLKQDSVNLDNAVKTFEDKVIYRPFTSLYKKLTTGKYVVDASQFEKVINILKENGFEKFAQKYEKAAQAGLKEIDGKKVIDFGTKDKKVKPLVNFVIAPFKFMWNTITLPYWMIDEKLMSVFRKSKPKAPMSDLSAVAQSFDKIYKQATKKDFNAEQFKDFVEVNLLKAFNLDSMSSVSNAELSNLAKTAASIATIWFLMTDNYNMVILKSNGNDKDGANTKFKERFVQEGSRLFYQTLLIDLFNSTFRNSYNASLAGMSWVTLADTTLGEILTRSSVGMPVEPHTRSELIAIENKQKNSTGFKKKYYDFMRRLTGKRSIESYEVDSKAQKPQTIAPETSSSSMLQKHDSPLEKMIAG